MHPQIRTVIDELRAAQERLHTLAAKVPSQDWPRRFDPERWSVAECVAHLNLTGRAYIPLIQEALSRGRPDALSASRRFRRDPVGWFLWRIAGPPVRMRTKTTAAFIPEATASASELVAEFDRLQAEQMACARNADGFPLDRLWITSPFDSRIRYNLYSCLTIIPMHQHRHLWQAEQVWVALQHGGAA